jgi:broad specificity phosphatase PhoE
VRLFLVRHGETESNRRGLALGQADVPLNERGRGQARRLAGALAREPFAAIYSSPLQRALETAGAIAEPHGLEVIVEPGLIEMDIGEVEGLTFPELREKFPALMHNWGGSEGPTFRMPGGERLVDVQARALKTLRCLAERRQADEAVCAVSHNFLILCILASVLGIPLADLRRLRQAVAGVSVVEIRPGRMRLVSMNDTCHLDSAG